MNAPIHTQGSLRYLWNHPIVIAGVMGLLLLMVTAISIIAIKAVGADDDRDTGRPGRNDPTQQATGQQALPAATGTGGPANQATGTQPAGTAPAVNTTGAVFLSGKLDIAYYDSGLDLDTAKESGLADGEKYDIDPTETSLNAVNRTQIGVGAAAGTPTPAACQAAGVKWGASAHVSVLTEGAVICVKTSDDRLGAFTVTKLDKSDDGQLQFVKADYVVWKKQGDQ